MLFDYRLFIRNLIMNKMSSSAAETRGRQTFTSASHGLGIVSGFQRLWQNSQMCDTRLIAQGQTFSVHR